MKNKQNLNEEILRIKDLLTEQLGSGYNCESDPTTPSGFACVQNQFGAGQFPDLPTCLASGCETATVTGCEGNPTLNCYFCHHQTVCTSFLDYYTWGSGAPGMNPSQAFMDTQVHQDPANPGVYLSHQGTPIYDSEANCVQQSGCEPLNFTNSNSSNAVGNLTPGCTDSAATNYNMSADGCEDINGDVDINNIDCCMIKPGGAIKPKGGKYKGKGDRPYYQDRQIKRRR